MGYVLLKFNPVDVQSVNEERLTQGKLLLRLRQNDLHDFKLVFR